MPFEDGAAQVIELSSTLLDSYTVGGVPGGREIPAC